jgi:hypothetical protein
MYMRFRLFKINALPDYAAAWLTENAKTPKRFPDDAKYAGHTTPHPPPTGSPADHHHKRRRRRNQ